MSNTLASMKPQNNALTPPGEWDTWCRSTQDLLDSDDFRKFLRIYNHHTAGSRANQEDATVKDVLRDRNLRNRMRAFFRDQVEWRLTGAAQAEVLIKISDMVDAAVKVLDERNKKIQSEEIEEGEVEDTKLLNKDI